MTMLKHRLYVDAPLSPGLPLTLDPDRSHYLCRVLRQRRGDRVVLFAGDGAAYEADIVTADPRACEVSIGACVATEPEPRLRLHLGQAMIKGERLDWVLQKATELAVTDIWLLQTERTEVHVAGPRLGRREQHWRRIVEGAAEQCGRLRLPMLHGPIPLASLLTGLPASQAYLLDPGSAALASPPHQRDTLLLVGPEGGFSDAERAAVLAAGATALGLGRLVLRADTAPVAAISVLRQAWHWAVP
jgi:16S rRNA (uracil1498-N3)-methyltransferase